MFLALSTTVSAEKLITSSHQHLRVCSALISIANSSLLQTTFIKPSGKYFRIISVPSNRLCGHCCMHSWPSAGIAWMVAFSERCPDTNKDDTSRGCSLTHPHFILTLLCNQPLKWGTARVSRTNSVHTASHAGDGGHGGLLQVVHTGIHHFVIHGMTSAN